MKVSLANENGISRLVKELRRLRGRARRASSLLADEYGSPNHNNKSDPLDELIFILLSQMTTRPSFERVYDRLKDAAPTWDEVLNMPLRKLRSLIKDAGLSNQKAPRIKAILGQLKRDFGNVSLDALQMMSTSEAEEYLTSLPGVQQKTAKCVLMYSLRRRVLPVDTHVLRVSRRVGLTARRNISPLVHQELERIVTPSDRYRFHVNAIAHGRAVCLAKKPQCSVCGLKRICSYPTIQAQALNCAPSP